MNQETEKSHKRCAMCPNKLKGIEERQQQRTGDKQKVKRGKAEMEFAVSNTVLNAQPLHFKSEQCRDG